MPEEYTRETVFGSKEQPAPDSEFKCPQEVRDALNALIATPELKLNTAEGKKGVIDYFLSTLNKLGANPLVRKIPGRVFSLAMTSTNGHFTSVLSQSGKEVEVKAMTVDTIPNKKKAPTDPQTYTVQVSGPIKCLDPEFPLRGWGTVRIQNIPTRELADKISGQINLGSVYKASGGFPKGTVKGDLQKGTSVTVFLNGPGDFDPTVRPDADPEWKDTQGFMEKYFVTAPIKPLLGYDGKSDATSPPRNQIWAIEGSVVSTQTTGGKDGRPQGYSLVIEDPSLDMNTRRSFDGGLKVFLPPALLKFGALQPGAIIRLLVSGSPGEYTARADNLENGTKKGQKIKTVNWRGIAGSVIYEGEFSNGSVPAPEAAAVPAAPVSQTDIIG